MLIEGVVGAFAFAVAAVHPYTRPGNTISPPRFPMESCSEDMHCAPTWMGDNEDDLRIGDNTWVLGDGEDPDRITIATT
jgi:hypothetical protein